MRLKDFRDRLEKVEKTLKPESLHVENVFVYKSITLKSSSLEVLKISEPSIEIKKGFTTVYLDTSIGRESTWNDILEKHKAYITNSAENCPVCKAGKSHLEPI